MDRDWIMNWQLLAIAFSGARTTTDVANVLITQGCAAFGAPRGLIGILDDRGQTLEMIQMGGFPPETRAAWARVPMTLDGPLTDCVASGRSRFYESPEADTTRFPHLAAARSPGDCALAALPLTTADGRTFGSIGLIFDRPRTFSDDERQQMVALGALCGQAMDRASIYEASQRDRQRAEDANRAKDIFLATISHDLRTPIAAILGWTRVLQKGTADRSQQEKALDAIERNAKAQVTLIDDLLEVNTLISGKALNLGTVDLPRMAENALEAVRPAADAKSVRLTWELGKDVKPIQGDDQRLQRVFWNLLSNAIKFTPAGGRVILRLHAAASHVEIRVEDSGCGIEPALLPHVFEAFRQGDEGGASGQERKGVGLGLAIAKNLVELHEGSITVASEGRDRGTTFTVRLPMAMGPLPTEPLSWPSSYPGP